MISLIATVNLTWGDFTALFVFGTFWFWLLLIGINLALAIIVDNEYGWATLATVVLFVAALQFICGIPVAETVFEHPLTILWIVGLYLVLGTGYATARWFSYVHDQRGLYDDYKAQFLKQKFVEDKNFVPESLKAEWSEKLHYENYTNKIDLHPQVNEHKSSIIMWMTWWPWSASAWILNDFVRKIFTHIYYHIRETLQSISDKWWKDVKGEYYTKQEYEQRR